MYNEFDGYEGVILKHNLAIGERIRKDGIIQEKDFNPITKSLIEEKLSFFKGMYEAKDLLAFYKDFLKQMYPTKPIINIKSKRVEEVFKELLNGEQSLELSEAQQIELKLKLKDYIVDSKHTNEIPHLKRINNFLLKEKIPYKISNPKRRINGIEKRIWKIEECAR